MINRKEAIRQYKELKTPRGIYAVRCAATGRRWVDSSLNLNATRNGLWVELRMGKHRNHELQAEWNAHGEANFVYEILETLPDDIQQLALRDTLKARRGHWSTALAASAII